MKFSTEILKFSKYKTLNIKNIYNEECVAITSAHLSSKKLNLGYIIRVGSYYFFDQLKYIDKIFVVQIRFLFFLV